MYLHGLAEVIEDAGREWALIDGITEFKLDVR